MRRQHKTNTDIDSSSWDLHRTFKLSFGCEEVVRCTFFPELLSVRTCEKWWYTEGNGLNTLDKHKRRACVHGTAGGALHFDTSCLQKFLLDTVWCPFENRKTCHSLVWRACLVSISPISLGRNYVLSENVTREIDNAFLLWLIVLLNVQLENYVDI